MCRKVKGVLTRLFQFIVYGYKQQAIGSSLVENLSDKVEYTSSFTNGYAS